MCCNQAAADKTLLSRRLKARPVPVLPTITNQTCGKDMGRKNLQLSLDHGHKSASLSHGEPKHLALDLRDVGKMSHLSNFLKARRGGKKILI